MLSTRKAAALESSRQARSSVRLRTAQAVGCSVTALLCEEEIPGFRSADGAGKWA